MTEKYRPNKDEYYWNIAKETAQRSNCMATKVGAIIVKDDQIVSTGYNGAPRGTKDCFERGGCLRRELNVPSGTQYEICRSVHAEQNAIINAARAGVALLGATLFMYLVKRTPNGDKFVTSAPCFICRKMMINAGITRFVGNDNDGKITSKNMDEWIKEWNEGDLFDSSKSYDSKYTKEEFEAMKKKD
jgi:dCMP deaminase